MDDFKRVTGDGPLLRVLHLHLLVGQQSEANQFLYPSRHQVGVVTFFPCGITFPDRIPLFEGDGSFWGFRRALRAAEEGGPWDIVHAHGPIDGMLYLLFCEWCNRSLGRSVYSAHHSYTNINFKKRNRLLSHGAFRFFERVTCVSEASMNSFPRRFHRLAKGRLSVVRNGVDLNRLDETLSAAAPLESKPSGFHVASVGRLIDIKDPMTVLAALRRVTDPDVRLTFVGTGELAEPLERAARDQPADVSLTGELSREQVYRFLHREADVYVSASHGEGMPMAPLEAMATGCPVILSDIPPHREIAEGTDFIPLVAVDDVEGFAREIETYRTMPPDQRRAIGARCRRVVEDRFSLQGMHDGYDHVYYDVLGQETSVVTPEDERLLRPSAAVT